MSPPTDVPESAGPPGGGGAARRRLARRGYRLRRRLLRGVGGGLSRVRRGEHAFVVVTAIVIGVLGGYGAIAFRWLLRWSTELFLGVPIPSLAGLGAMPWWQRLLTPAVGGLIVGIVAWRIAPEVRGSGVPEVMEAVARRGGAIRPRVVAAKAFAAAVTIGSGGSAGREGPIVHIGSAIGSTMGQLLEVGARRLRTFVGCGVAAAIAATFNAPIAGALFSVEIVLGDLAVASLSPIVISSVVATVVSRHHLGDFPAFRVPAYELVSSVELLGYALLGVAAAVVGIAFVRTLDASADLFERVPLPEWLRPGLGGLGVGAIALLVPEVFGVGYETIDAALWGRVGAGALAVAVLAKIVATSLTLGSGGSGGVFAPSLFLGAGLGAVIGTVVHGAFPAWTATPGAYALVGMGAVVSGTTFAPITAILMMFELTNDYTIIPPLMTACVVSVLITTSVDRESIYTSKLARRGVRLEDGRDVDLLRSITVGETMQPDVETVPASMPFAELVARLLAGTHPELLVVDDDGALLGVISLSDVRTLLPESESLARLAVAADLLSPDVVFVVPSDTLDVVMHLLGRTHRDEVPVCSDAASRRVEGIVSRDAVIDAYNRRVFQADLSGNFGSLLRSVAGGRTIEVLGGVHLGEVTVPPAWDGRTLAEADLRRLHGLEVVLIHSRSDDAEGVDGRPGRFPAPGARLRAGDSLLVMGSAESIRRLR